MSDVCYSGYHVVCPHAVATTGYLMCRLTNTVCSVIKGGNCIV